MRGYVVMDVCTSYEPRHDRGVAIFLVSPLAFLLAASGSGCSSIAPGVDARSLTLRSSVPTYVEPDVIHVDGSHASGDVDGDVDEIPKLSA